MFKSINSDDDIYAIKTKYGHLSDTFRNLCSVWITIDKLYLSEFSDHNTRGTAWLNNEIDSDPKSEYIISIDLHHGVDDDDDDDFEAELWVICAPNATSRHYHGQSIPMRNCPRLVSRAYKIIETDYIERNDSPIIYRTARLEYQGPEISKAIMEIAEWQTTSS